MSDKIKEKLESKDKSQDHVLTDFEYAFLNELSILLQFHTEKDKVLGNYMTYIAKVRLGYDKVKEGHNLIFNIRDEEGLGVLTITEVKV